MSNKEPATNRPISLVIPHIVSLLRSDAQTQVEDFFSKLSILDARMMSELLQYGELTMTSLVEIVGNDSAQVSRALKRLMAIKHIQRDTLRSPLRLSAGGKAIAQKMRAGGIQHAKALSKGLSREEQESFMTSISHLTQVAGRLLEQERQLDGGNGRPMTRSRYSRIGPALINGPMLPEMLSARLIALAIILQRSSFLAFKRLTDLSNNESMVLAYVWEYGPIAANSISQLTGRTKNRIERTAALLTQMQLIQRGKLPSSNDWVFDRVDAGSDAYKKLAAEIGRRERFLIHDFTPAELKRFRALLNRVATNAAAIRH